MCGKTLFAALRGLKAQQVQSRALLFALCSFIMCVCFATYYLAQNCAEFFLDFEHPTFQRRCHPLLVSNIITTGTPISGVMAFTGRVRPPGTAWPRRSAKSAMSAPQSRLMGRSVWWLAV